MGLQDVVRQYTYATRDAISLLAEEIQRLTRDMKAFETEAHTREEETKSFAGAIAEKDRTIRDLRNRVDELQTQFESLRVRLDQNRAELLNVESELNAVLARQKALRTAAANALERARKLEAQVAKSMEEQGNLEQKLVKEERIAFAAYQQQVWEQLLACQQSESDIASKRAAREALDAARRDDPVVADLFEARAEWRLIVQSSASEPVKRTAAQELTRIDRDLESRFPGALEAIDRNMGREELQELFFMPVDADGACLVFLPVPEQVWSDVRMGSTDSLANLAMHLCWAFIKALRLSDVDSRFFTYDGLCVLHVARAFEDLNRLGSVPLEFSPHSKVDFVLSPIPSEVQESLHVQGSIIRSSSDTKPASR